MMDKEKQLLESTNSDNEIDIAIAEAEYVSEEQLIDALIIVISPGRPIHRRTVKARRRNYIYRPTCCD